MSVPRQPIDGLCMVQACWGVLLDLHCALEQWADHYEIPSEALRAMMSDIFIFQRSGIETISAEEFAEYANVIIAEQLKDDSNANQAIGIPPDNSPETKRENQINNLYSLEDQTNLNN
jgi:hypothetical protein